MVLAVVVVVAAVVVVVAEEVEVIVVVVAKVEVVVVVAEIIVVLAAETICLMKGMVLIDDCRKNFNNPAIFLFKPTQIACTCLMLIFPA